MCGIVGVWEFKDPVDRGVLESMRDTLAHRGPDDAGTFFDDETGVGLGHRRLSILDPSPAGHQPMEFDGVYAVHNGEVYNFHDLRDLLSNRGYAFRSNSDTEVILKGYREWGLEMVTRFRGMFATALWDAGEKRLHLIRDRAGVKPLYYYRDSSRFIFASELKAVIHHPGVRREVNHDALALYFKLGYVPAPHSIFSNVFKLEPGHILTVAPGGRTENSAYWDVFDRYRSTQSHGYAAGGVIEDEESAAGELERILTESFKLRLVSDVPVGVFLSGGIDSSTVAALLQKDSTARITTFTIGFADEAYNEAEEARKIADYLGTDHHELYLDPKTALDIIPRLPEIYDEPFGDASGIPTYLVSKFARGRVKVALSADGGDELFAGYRIHQSLSRAYRLLSSLGPFKNPAVGIAGFPPVTRALGRVLAKKPGEIDLKLKKLREILAGDQTMSEFYFTSRSIWSDIEVRRLLHYGGDATTGFLAPFREAEGGMAGFVDFMRAADYRSYMADDILVKVDRAAMAVGLESREPFLDQNVVEFAARLHTDFLYRDGVTKVILKKILYKHVPRELMERPKSGFVVPLDLWLKKELKFLLTDYLNQERIEREGELDWPAIKTEMDAFLNAPSASSLRLWLLLEYELWREKWLG